MKSFKFLRFSVVTTLALSLVFGGLTASAQTATTTLTEQIKVLLAQIQSLQQQIAAKNNQLGGSVSEMRHAINLTRQLSRGMSNEEVTTLQEILAADPEIYPEGVVSGFFGALTEKAVRKFQQKHGLDQVGTVGPKTRAALFNFVNNISTTTRSLPPGLAKKLNQTLATTTTSSTTPSGVGATVTLCHIPPGNPSAKQTITVGAPAMRAHLAHGDTLGACTTATATTTPPATTTPTDTTAPILSNISVSTTSPTTVVVSWGTNENADSAVWYGTSTPLDTNTAPKIESETLKMSHAINLSGLVASTTYYYRVASKDAAKNNATSSEASFLTP
jgi:peptidoglycan hydrolase-like protein with peptidoglycan-binding domain